MTSATFGPDTVGAKSLNTVALKVGLIPQHVNPCSSSYILTQGIVFPVQARLLGTDACF